MAPHRRQSTRGPSPQGLSACRAVVTRGLEPLWAAAFASCGASPTAARIVVDFESGLDIDQLRLQGLVADMSLFSLEAPPASQGEMRPGQDIVILFDDEVADQTIDLVAAGLEGAVEIARGSCRITVLRGQVVRTSLTLSRTAGCPAGQHQCDASCFTDDDAPHCGLACALARDRQASRPRAGARVWYRFSRSRRAARPAHIARCADDRA